MNRVAVASYTPLIQETSRDWISELLRQGDAGRRTLDPRTLILHTVLDLTMTVNYGRRLPPDQKLFDELLDVEESVSGFRSVVGAAQDYVPLLRWNPVNRKSAHARATNARRLAYLAQFGEEHKRQMRAGTDKPCIQGNVLRDPDHEFTDVELMSINMSMVSGGIDTLANTLIWTVGILARRPDVQEVAYDAICHKHGEDCWGDVEEEKVPYLSALVKEALRYFSVLRLSLPRSALRDIEYQGMSIPKGTTVFLNAWGCNRGITSTYLTPDQQFR
jgi:3-hydroxyphenylacetate 6-hydroxylase